MFSCFIDAHCHQCAFRLNIPILHYVCAENMPLEQPSIHPGGTTWIHACIKHPLPHPCFPGTPKGSQGILNHIRTESLWQAVHLLCALLPIFIAIESPRIDTQEAWSVAPATSSGSFQCKGGSLSPRLTSASRERKLILAICIHNFILSVTNQSAWL